MVDFATRTAVTAEEWAAEREVALTEELDARLRAHRWVGWLGFCWFGRLGVRRCRMEVSCSLLQGRRVGIGHAYHKPSICTSAPCTHACMPMLMPGAWATRKLGLHHNRMLCPFSLRPRAGRIEEETRLARSVELVGQRRRVEAHLRLQVRCVT